MLNASDSGILQTAAYRYELPAGAIAREPVSPPDAARLLVLKPGSLEHRSFRDFADQFVAGDVLVINETRVIRARLHGTREPGGGRVEVLLLRPADGAPFHYGARSWLALVKPGRKLRAGARIAFGDGAAAEVTAVDDDGVRIVRFADGVDLEPLLERYGEVPLPPYVGPGDGARAARYQTVFARVPGSVAAPTASLHFTPAVLDAIRGRGVTIAALTLDVGLGTFRPMETESIVEHRMHAERYAISAATAAVVNEAKRTGRRVIVAGTTALRALEASAAGNAGTVIAGEAETALFIVPGFRFRIADALLTNFHLPASTLLVLVAAFAGYEQTMAAYATAIAEGYRFYSFGDAMYALRMP